MLRPGQIWIADESYSRMPACIIALAEEFDSVLFVPVTLESAPLAVELPNGDCRVGEPTAVDCGIIAEVQKNALEVHVRSLEEETLNRILTAVAVSLGIELKRENSLVPCQADPCRGDVWSIDLQPVSEGRTVGLIVSSDIYKEKVESDFLAISVAKGEELVSSFDVFVPPELSSIGYGVTIELPNIATFQRTKLGKKMGTLGPEAMQLVDSKLRQLYSSS